MLFQLVEIELDDKGHMIAERRTLPLFELHQDALAMAEFAASRCHGDYGYDEAADCWWGAGRDGRRTRFVVQPTLEAAA
jgi:hypothetical protein